MNGGRKVYLRRYSKSILLLFCHFAKNSGKKKTYNCDLWWKKKMAFAFGLFFFLSLYFSKIMKLEKIVNKKILKNQKKLRCPLKNLETTSPSLDRYSPFQFFPFIRTWRLSIWKVLGEVVVDIIIQKCLFLSSLSQESCHMNSWSLKEIKFWSSLST